MPERTRPIRPWGTRQIKMKKGNIVFPTSKSARNRKAFLEEKKYPIVKKTSKKRTILIEVNDLDNEVEYLKKMIERAYPKWSAPKITQELARIAVLLTAKKAPSIKDYIEYYAKVGTKLQKGREKKK